ncbi:MAG: hypothetical protein IJU33_02325 [Bacteroidales bacterium]|nr:hypothetical protein [Bacteroidales bacterium]
MNIGVSSFLTAPNLRQNCANIAPAKISNQQFFKMQITDSQYGKNSQECFSKSCPRYQKAVSCFEKIIYGIFIVNVRQN